MEDAGEERGGVRAVLFSDEALLRVRGEEMCLLSKGKRKGLGRIASHLGQQQ